jgi:hypothetical protein
VRRFVGYERHAGVAAGQCLARLYQSVRLFVNYFQPSMKLRSKMRSGRFHEFDWNGNLVWEFEYHSEKRLPHHDAIKLPNGNVLAICWEWIDEKRGHRCGPTTRERQGFSPSA